MTIINFDFSPEAKLAKQQAINEQIYACWKNHKKLELIIRDSMDNIEELTTQQALQSTSEFFQEVQILTPEQALAEEQQDQDHRVTIRNSA